MGSHSEDQGNELPVESANLEFITFTDINQATHPETKKKVRSHVMHQVQRSLRSEKRKGKEREVVLDLSLLSQTNASPSRDPSNSMSALALVPRLHDLGAGRSDPFIKYPIDMDVRAHELFDHLHSNTCPMFKTMSTIGFFRAVADEAGFRQILCTSSSHMTRLRDGTETAEAIALSTKAIRSINRRLADPGLSISDGVIITILAFACHAVMFNDKRGLLIHFNGLEGVIRQRGGLRALGSNSAIRMVLFWTDVNTAFIHDRCPRFPPPTDILPRISPQPLLPPGPPLLQACLTDEMTRIITELLALNQLMAHELTTRDLWDDGVFAGLYIVPILGKLLSTRPEHNPAPARQEVCRIGAVLYLAAIRRRFGVGLATNVYIPRLRDSILAQGALLDPGETDPVLPWALVVGGVQSFGQEGHKWFVSAMADLVLRRRYGKVEELVSTVCGVLWIDGILEKEFGEFQGEVSAECWASYDYTFS